MINAQAKVRIENLAFLYRSAYKINIYMISGCAPVPRPCMCAPCSYDFQYKFVLAIVPKLDQALTESTQNLYGSSTSYR